MLVKRHQWNEVTVGVSVAEQRPQDMPPSLHNEKFEPESPRRPEEAMREVGGRVGGSVGGICPRNHGLKASASREARPGVKWSDTLRKAPR